jgi:PAS domain S-box-containing protein
MDSSGYSLEKHQSLTSSVEADELVVAGEGGAQQFTLKDADQSCRTLIENVCEGALTLTPEGLVLYANRRFAQMLRTPPENVIGSEIHNWFAAENQQVLQILLQRENSHAELNLAAADGTQELVFLSMSRLVLHDIDAVCMVVTDLTEQKHTQAILDAEKLSNAILQQAADTIVICDKNGRIMRASNQAQAFYGKSPIGQLF